jgi:hypothetical protein
VYHHEYVSRQIRLLHLMDWTHAQKLAFNSLLVVVVRDDSQAAARAWVMKSVPVIEQAYHYPTWQIAQLLLLAQSSLWHLSTWRNHLLALRNWQFTQTAAFKVNGRDLSPEHIDRLCHCLDLTSKSVM